MPPEISLELAILPWDLFCLLEITDILSAGHLCLMCPDDFSQTNSEMMLPHHLRHLSLGHGLVIKSTFDSHLNCEGIFGKPQLGRVITACAFELDYSACVLAE
jgi:hypothetical protein